MISGLVSVSEDMRRTSQLILEDALLEGENK